MKNFVKLLSLFGILVATTSFTTKDLCFIVAESDEHIPVDAGTGIDQQTFNRVLDNFTTVYNPIVKKEGYRLSIKRKWSDDTINANTTVSGSAWEINAFGGLARYPMMDYNAFLMVMCHEMGHHLGGYPANGWASNEGQSDYYATSKCFRRMAYAGFVDNLNSAKVPQSVKLRCSSQHKNKQDALICEKGAETGLTLASILNKLNSGKKPVSLETPDTSEVGHTDDSHPDAQCRADTYYAGAVCEKPFDLEFSRDEPKTGACSEENGETIGVRSHCWYKPSL